MKRKMLAFGSAVLMSAILPGVGFAQDHPVPDAANARDLTIPDPVILTADATTPSRDTSAPATNGGNPAAAPAIESAGEPPATDPAAPDTPSGTAATDSGWHLSVSPYLWFPGTHGDIGALGRNVGFHASATDILSHFRFGVMGAVQARHQRLLLSMDVISVRLADDKAFPAPGLGELNANLTTHSVFFTPKIGLRLINAGKIKIDALSGIRFWYFGEDLSFSPSRSGINYSASQNWVSPVIGGRLEAALSPKMVLTILGDAGGWGAGSQLEYQVVGSLGYRLKPKLTLEAGYRYMYVDYMGGGNTGAVVKAALSGVLVGLTFQLGSPQ